MPAAEHARTIVDELLSTLAGLAAAERSEPSGPSAPLLLGLACPHLPAELPHALGLLPRRIVLAAAPLTQAPGHLQAFCCSWARALLDQGLTGALDDLVGIVLPCNSCDSLQNMTDVWRRSGARPYEIYALRQPARRDGKGALDLLEAEHRLWLRWLERLAGRTLDPIRLSASACLFNRLRAALRQLRALAARGQILPGQLHKIVVAAQTLEREPLADLLEEALVRLARPAQRANEAKPRARLALVGGLLDSAALLDWLDEQHALVVIDDTCAVGRSVAAAVDLDPCSAWTDLARRHLRRPPCPGHLGSGEARAEQLLAQIARQAVQGVVLLCYKGCDPQAFDNVILTRMLKERGIPQLVLEIDPHLGDTAKLGQLTTRLEAFLEMLSGAAEVG